MPKPPTTVAQYLASLPEDLRREVARVRDEINRRLPAGYEEGIQYGMIGWYVPHSIFPRGYHCDPAKPLPFAALAGRKHGVSVAFMSLYADKDGWRRFQDAWKATGERLDKGVCCVRFREAKDATVRLLGDVVSRIPVDRYVARYVEMLRSMGKWSDDAKAAPARATKRRPARTRSAAAAKPRRR